MNENKKQRTSIPIDVKRKALIESGFKCSVPQCFGQWPTLHFHHIDENPSNNVVDNILVLCPTHHQMATSGYIDKKHCNMIKELQKNFKMFNISSEENKRNQLLYSLITELHTNLHIFNDASFKEPDNQLVVFPRFLRIVLDQVIASGAFIYEQDKELYFKLYDYLVGIDDINRRLDISEFRDFPTFFPNKLSKLRKSISTGPAFNGLKARTKELFKYLIDNYGEEMGVDWDTEVLGVKCSKVFGLD